MAGQGPTGLGERALGPDLARGFMLLFIALANSHYFVAGGGYFAGFPTDGSALDRVVGVLISTLVDGRAFPMFGLLFGYGVAQIVRRQREAGSDWWRIRTLLWRRSLVLVVLGFLHAMLLYIGDILAAYGVLHFLGVWALRWKDRWLLVVAAFVLVLTALPSDDTLAASAEGPDPSMLPANFAGQFGERIVVQPFIAGVGWIGFVTPFLIGLWAGRRRILERPAVHLTLLRTTALLGLTIAAVGQRSLTCYLSQSVVWAVVFTPYLLDLSNTLTTTTTALLAFATWLATVLLAERMRRANYRGPFELLIRRVTYRRAVSRSSG